MAETVRCETDGRVATVTLDRPDRFDAIDDRMPGELREAIQRADADQDVRVTVLTGAGDAFCSGYDLERDAERPRPTEGSQSMPWGPDAGLPPREGERGGVHVHLGELHPCDL